MKLKCFLFFAISNLLIQLNAQALSLPPCEGALCQGVCVDLMVTASNLPSGACAGEFSGGFQYQLDITGLGADSGNYNILTFNNSGFSNGFFVHNSGDSTTWFPTIIPIAEGCETIDQTYTYEIRCPDDDSLLASGTIGTVTVYPQPFLFAVFSTPPIECGATPFIFPPDCGELILDEIPPINDCDNLTPGVVNYEVDPGFDLANAPACFTDVLTGEIPIPYCGEDCPCDVIFCNGVCTDIILASSQFPVTQCANSGEPITINITGQGAADAYYTVNIFDNNGNPVGNYFHLLGDPTSFDFSPVFSGTFCEPTTFQLTYQVGCYEYGGNLIATGVLGDITVYPDANLFLPEIIESQPCGVSPVILPATCGTITTNPNPIPNSQCGDGAQDQVVMWSADFGFDTTNAPDCFMENEIMGEFTIFGCTDGQGAPCFLACLGEGVLDENCACVIEDSPQVIFLYDPPVAACQGEALTIIISFDGTMPPGSSYELLVTDQNGNLINSFFVDSTFPFLADLFDSNNYDPCIIREATYTFTLRCIDDLSIIGTPITTDPITIYPSPLRYVPFDIPAIACESEPQIFLNDDCEASINIIETVLPVDDCDAPQDGYVSWEVVPPFDITNAPECFTSQLNGQEPIPPCLSDCICDGIVCQDVCVDLIVTVSNLPAEICSDAIQYQMEVTGPGADLGYYIIRTYDNNGILVGSAVHNPGQSTTLFPYISNASSFLGSCEPIDQTYIYEIVCQGEGTILASGTVGTAIMYPEIEDFFPDIIPSIACEQDLRIKSPFCGTLILDPDPIPVPGCGGEDAQVNWSVDFGFEYPTGCNVSPIEGTETVFACDGTPGNPCNDNSPCTENDTLDENCNCIGEGPIPSLASPLPEAVCSQEELTIPVTIDNNPPTNMLVTITDNNGSTLGLDVFSPVGSLTINVLFAAPFTDCFTQETELFITLRCPMVDAPIGSSVPIGSIVVYPYFNNFKPIIEPAILCDAEPVIIPPLCGDLILNVSPQSPITCPVGNNGFVDWTVDTGFDISTAPDCFDTTVLSGQELITACTNCCPLVVDVSIADSGPFCSGDITEVCVTFDAAFETDGQITINGVDALSGENQICFQLDMVNESCNYQPTQLVFEIICNQDGSVSNAITPDVLVAPNPANFQYVVYEYICGFPGDIVSLSACFVVANSAIVLTEPVEDCPPVDGEAEIPLLYYDDNFNPLDVAAFGCSGFDTSIIVPIPGCSTCPCPNQPVNITMTENACEGGLLEICLEFEEGDEANAIGTLVSISTNTAIVAQFLLNGDGMSTIYCSEFYLFNTFVDCVPVTEDLSVVLFCHDGTQVIGGMVTTTIYPSLDKFSFEVVPAVDNCPLEFAPPNIIATGTCDLDIQSAITTTPVNGCPPVQGEITYSVNYIDTALFTATPVECLFTPVENAVEPILACETCDGDCEDEIMGTVFAPLGCDVNGIEVTIYDDMGNVVVVLTTNMNGVYESTAYPCGNYSVALTNYIPQCYLDASGETGPKTFVIDADNNNMDTDGQNFMPIAIPTLSQWGLIILCLLLMSFGAIKMTATVKLATRI